MIGVLSSSQQPHSSATTPISMNYCKGDMSQRIETLADGITLYCGDCRAILPTLRSVDAIITDPPYGNSNHDGDYNAVLNAHRGIENKPIANDDEVSMREVVDAMLTEAARLLPKDRSACCVFTSGGGGPRLTFTWLAERMNRGGLEFFHSLIWDKRNPGLGQRYRRQHEMIMVAHRAGGRIRWNVDNRLVPNVLSMMPPRERQHPNEKPLELIAELVDTHSNPGDHILDPFMGSGTTGVAAIRLGRKFTGVEIDPLHFDIACKRIQEELKQPDMFIAKPPPAQQNSLDFEDAA
jgi:site-specific DNA-methyltransferase (adenine-specific)